ncbi:hypothetical protein PUN28_016020 [Cardiocondyla obscurior]|uniref:Uncharacterized protein n=1 Tax=Cardiocondyla obscurior TaxID=286306 RepID=A0AAW2EUA1_9HYME
MPCPGRNAPSPPRLTPTPSSLTVNRPPASSPPFPSPQSSARHPSCLFSPASVHPSSSLRAHFGIARFYESTVGVARRPASRSKENKITAVLKLERQLLKPKSSTECILGGVSRFYFVEIESWNYRRKNILLYQIRLIKNKIANIVGQSPACGHCNMGLLCNKSEFPRVSFRGSRVLRDFPRVSRLLTRSRYSPTRRSFLYLCIYRCIRNSSKLFRSDLFRSFAMLNSARIIRNN